MKHQAEFPFDDGGKKPEGEKLRDEGIERVVDHTPKEYRDAFHKAAEQIISEGRWFTSEDITARCGMPPNHHHAVGGLMFGLVTGKIAEPVTDSKSRVPSSHAARLRLYRGISQQDKK
jgi:hypothetical protein